MCTRDEIKDALPASPTEDSPRQSFPDTQAAVSSYDAAPISVPGSHHPAPNSHSHPQVSPLTPPERYGYHQDYIRAPQPSMSRPSLPQYPPPAGTLSFSYDGAVPQLWDMDGAPASPPPLPDFNLFMPPHQAPHHYAPPPAPAPAHRPPTPPPLYTHPPPIPPISTTHRNSVPTIAAPVRRSSATYHAPIRPPQPHPIRTALPHPPPPPPAFRDGSYHHSPQSYAPPGTSPTNPNPNPNPLPMDYRASFCKNEDEGLGDHECLRLRLLEEAYGQRPPQGGPPQAAPGGAGVYVGPSQHSPHEWANGGQRCVIALLPTATWG
ncbi:hypothetical protein C8Q76DRAFT_24115 [Earliella scabrosa]|nr:hypothetical protein C8Q76DRAFT_24115 [Earliella scabrosa]